MAFPGRPRPRPRAPTHIHGITTKMLVGAPSFAAVAPVVADLVAGRVLVAHNAVFDWGFLQAESLRCVADLDSSHRLCTLALARRLDLDVRDFKLGTLAAWANIHQLQAHSAVDDVRVLESIFLKLMLQAIHGQVTLPMSANTTAARQPYGERAPSVSSPWEPVGAWTEGTTLVQGMRFVITGGTRTPRTDLYADGINAGLIPMNSVSTKTSLLVCNHPNLLTRKASRADELGTAVVTEERFQSLLRVVRPGTPISARPIVRITTTTAAPGPLKGYRVLVLGGPHPVSARVRDEVMAKGGRVAVNLTPTVSHLVAFDAADTDIRYARTTHLLRLDPTTLELCPAMNQDPPGEPERAGGRDDQSSAVAGAPGSAEPDLQTPGPAPSAARILRRGEVTDLPEELTTWDLYVQLDAGQPTAGTRRRRLRHRR